MAGYERGERAISLERFWELAGFYGVPADRLLADVLARLGPEGRRELVIDLERLMLVVDDEGSRVQEFVEEVRTKRRERQAEIITLRSGDLEALALASHLKPRALMAKLLPAVRKPAGSTGED